MIELTLDQARALAETGEHPPTVIDPTTRRIYTLVPADACTSAPEQDTDAPVETPVEPWKHLVARKHPWRKQLYLKGRNMTVRQLVWSAKANKLTEEQAAANYDLPVEAIREAFAYAEANRELLDMEGSYERYLLAQGGKRRGPRAVS